MHTRLRTRNSRHLEWSFLVTRSLPSPLRSRPCYHPMNCARCSLGRGRALYDAINQHVSQLISTVTKSRSGNEPPPTRTEISLKFHHFLCLSVPPISFRESSPKYLKNIISENCELIVSLKMFKDRIRISIATSYIFWKEMEMKLYFILCFILFFFFLFF